MSDLTAKMLALFLSKEGNTIRVKTNKYLISAHNFINDAHNVTVLQNGKVIHSVFGLSLSGLKDELMMSKYYHKLFLRPLPTKNPGDFERYVELEFNPDHQDNQDLVDDFEYVIVETKAEISSDEHKVLKKMGNGLPRYTDYSHSNPWGHVRLNFGNSGNCYKAVVLNIKGETWYAPVETEVRKKKIYPKPFYDNPVSINDGVTIHDMEVQTYHDNTDNNSTLDKSTLGDFLLFHPTQISRVVGIADFRFDDPIRADELSKTKVKKGEILQEVQEFVDEQQRHLDTVKEARRQMEESQRARTSSIMGLTR